MPGPVLALVVTLTRSLKVSIKFLVLRCKPEPCPIRVHVISQWDYISILFGSGPVGSSKYMMPLNLERPSKIAMVHIVRKDTPQLFQIPHSLLIRSISSGGKVSIPISLHSDTIPSIKLAISLESKVLEPK